ncbi:hypothetical protein Q8791_20810 [Nocardiopsis sp. CT-R113]|uniref:Uncharacterized protein n=1 Tax=Nocardiopsis codii TaxID=3065942 RepID=A0ABU7KBQ3_9ACTN|nr:hypothetical protein [Nocardiopsis sp. CT-R113]MEE2039664.1 hypothetical protein [Nocardiopsis sp. CT-R113]
MDKICPTCLQPWTDCVCVVPARQNTASGPVYWCPWPHPVLSQQLGRPLLEPFDRAVAADPTKEFCRGCSQPWPSCHCEGGRL